MKLLGILEIENRTDILAFAAFLMSLLSVGYTIKTFLVGSNVILFRPNSVIFVAVKYHNLSDPYIATIANFSYSNDGDRGYSSIVMRESVEFTVNGNVIEQDWHAFVATTTQQGIFNLSGEIVPVFKDAAAPFVLDGGNSQSHETFMASRTVACVTNQDGCDVDRAFVTVENFTRHFKRLREGSQETMPFRVTLTSDIRGDGIFRGSDTEHVKCVLMIRVQDLDSLQNETSGYFSRPCVDGGD